MIQMMFGSRGRKPFAERIFGPLIKVGPVLSWVLISLRSFVAAAALLALATRPAAAADCAEIQAAIDALPPRGGEVQIAKGVYVCSTPIIVDRNNVMLRGEGAGTLLRLANGANAPVLVLGQTLPVPTETRSRIVVADLWIDGNRSQQTAECYQGPCSPTNPLRNNGITLRRVTDARIERVVVRRARSGGLVSELGCRRLTIRDFASSDNQFDGLAGYETEDSILSGIQLYANLAAGFSFDIHFNRNTVSDVVIADSGSVGIFMRDSRDNLFHGLRVRNSAQHGIFLAQVDTNTSTPAAGNTFSGVVVSDSGGAGIRANDPSCVDNLVDEAQLIGNAGGCFSEALPGLLNVFASICR